MEQKSYLPVPATYRHVAVPARFGYYSPAAAAGYAVAAKGIYEGGKSLMGFFRKTKKRKRYTPMAQPRRAISRGRRIGSRAGVVLPQGTRQGAYKIAGRRVKRRRKKSIRDVITTIKRNMPKQSHKTVHRQQFYVMDSGSANTKGVFNIPLARSNEYETDIATLTKIDSNTQDLDFTSSNTKIKIDTFVFMNLKNNNTANCSVKYAFYKCIDDDNESPLKEIVDVNADRGYTFGPTIDDAKSPTATSSTIPEKFILDATVDAWHAPIHSSLNGRKWKQLGKVVTASIGPGDSLGIKWSRNNFVYKPEVFDREPFGVMKNMDVNCIIVVKGDLGHDVSNKNKIGYSPWHIDMDYKRTEKYTYPNPKGLDEHSYTSEITDTGITDIKMADDVQSAMESAAD